MSPKKASWTPLPKSKAKGDFEFAATLQYEEGPKISKSIESVQKELASLQKQHSWLRQVVGAIEVAEVVAAWSRIPPNNLLKEETAALLSMEERMGLRVFGQQEALDVLGKAVRRARVGVGDPQRPYGVFMFVGPTVGQSSKSSAEIFETRIG